MVTIQNIKEIKSILTNDESFCKLVYYGDNPLSQNNEDVRNLADFDSIIKKIVKLSPQIEDMNSVEEIRIIIIKSFTKLELQDKALRKDTIEISLLIPYRFQENDLRVYQIEDVIVNLIDGITISGLGNMDYESGQFVKSPVDNFCLYRMIFSKKQSRGEGMYGRY